MVTEKDPINPESAIEDAIFRLNEVEDMRDNRDIRELVVELLKECLRPALAVLRQPRRSVRVAAGGNCHVARIGHRTTGLGVNRVIATATSKTRSRHCTRLDWRKRASVSRNCPPRGNPSLNSA